jgi:hypothetical protein
VQPGSKRLGTHFAEERGYRHVAGGHALVKARTHKHKKKNGDGESENWLGYLLHSQNSYLEALHVLVINNLHVSVTKSQVFVKTRRTGPSSDPAHGWHAHNKTQWAITPIAASHPRAVFPATH